MNAFRSSRQREWETLCRREERFLNRRRNRRESVLNRFLEEKVPTKLQYTLDSAFQKAFALVFEKGTGLIEKTYKKEKMERDFKISLYADSLKSSRRSLRVFSKRAWRAGCESIALSGISGIGMGILGVGIPDIPVFTAMLLRCVYEISVHYGYAYDTAKEKYFILLLIEGGVSCKERLDRINREIDSFIQSPVLPENYSYDAMVARASSVLSKELLYMKFLQGIPVAGAVGGAWDVFYMQQISAFARLKYQKRFLLDKKNVQK